MSDGVLILGLLSAVGFAIRMWFWFAGGNRARVQRMARRDAGDFGLSFDERVARRLAELDEPRT
jgi:hypothetical protein